MITRIIMFIIGLAAIAAAVISYNLTIKHIAGSSGMAWFEAGCSNEAGSGQMNCAKVLESPYSYIPPKHPDTSGGIHIPASFLGLLYYSAIFLWMVGVGRPSTSRRWIHLIPIVMVSAGLISSAYFIFVMYRVIHEWCPWCLVTHALNLLIAMGMILIWPSREQTATADSDQLQGASSGNTITSIEPVPHPSARTLAITMIAIFLAYYGHLNVWENETAKKERNAFSANYNTCLTAVDRIKKNTGMLLQNWQSAPAYDIEHRPDDPVRLFASTPPGERWLDVVVFSDFECPSCARFAQFFEKSVPALFDGHIRLTYRHFPLDSSCNAQTTAKMHPHACGAAYLAEGSRVAGGNDAFWKAYDFLYEHRDELAAGKINAGSVAEVTGLSAEVLQKASESPAVRERIALDTDQGKRSNLRGTPYILVEGRPLDPLMATELGFWDKLADWFWLEKAKGERPQSTRLAPNPLLKAPNPDQK